MTPPDREARAGLIRSSLKDFAGISLQPSALEQAAKRWDGFSVARIRAVMDEAGRTSRSVHQSIIDYPALQAALRTVQGNQGDRLPADTPLLTDLTMDSDQKTKLLGIAHRMKHIESVEEMGGSVPTGVLFWGPPGTGKTLTVRSLAKESSWALLSTSGSDLLAKHDAIDKLVARAANIRPCIVFIDEADDILGDRRNGGAVSVTNKLLAAIDGSKGKVPDVMWVAATNHPDVMDSAALRGGRFTEKIEFKESDLEGAAALAEKWMKSTRACLAAEMTPYAIGQILDGETPANIMAILQQAVNTAIERCVLSKDKPVVMLADIETAKAVVLG